MNKKAKAFIILLSLMSLAVLLLLSVAIAKPADRVVKACDDGYDNDNDGYTDWPNDPGCANRNDNSELNPSVACDDGSDNDGDGLTDTLDPGCYSVTDTSELNPAVACDDGYDNDGDGYTDTLDPGCYSVTDTSELNPAIECDDGSDNDGDSSIDMNDNGCSSPTDNDETNCGDGVCEGGEDSNNCAVDCGVPDSCGETDSGFDVQNFGIIYGDQGGQFVVKNDTCASGTELTEFYCTGTVMYNSTVDCSWYNLTVCSYGACV